VMFVAKAISAFSIFMDSWGLPTPTRHCSSLQKLLNVESPKHNTSIILAWPTCKATWGLQIIKWHASGLLKPQSKAMLAPKPKSLYSTRRAINCTISRQDMVLKFLYSDCTCMYMVQSF
jgi:hypothetical protein